MDIFEYSYPLILMHLIFYFGVWLDNVMWDSISFMRYTVGISLTSFIMFISLDAACNAPFWEKTAKVHFYGDNHIQNFLWGGISSDIRSEIFYSSAHASP